MALSKQSQMFLQALMGGGPLTAKKAANLYNTCGERVAEQLGEGNPKSVASDGNGLEAVADRINPKLELGGLAIKTVYSPWEQETFWGVVNTVSDDAAKLATGLTSAQLVFFFAMVDELLEDGGSMKLVDMQNAGTDHKLTVSQAGRTIQALNKEGWLKIRQRAGHTTRVVFGARAMLELPNVRSFILSDANGNGTGGNADDTAAPRNEDAVDDDDDDGDGGSEEEVKVEVSRPERKRRRKSSKSWKSI
jgi:hypothetical protein